jgi:hypothetical protein
MFVRAVEMVRRPGLFRAENDADARRSFAAVEWHDSDRVLVKVYRTAGRQDRCLSGLA